jgi:hypothetical protein
MKIRIVCRLNTYKYRLVELHISLFIIGIIGLNGKTSATYIGRYARTRPRTCARFTWQRAGLPTGCSDVTPRKTLHFGERVPHSSIQ